MHTDIRIIGTLGKYGCENRFPLFILLIFHKKKSQKYLTFHCSKTNKCGEKSHYEINVFL